VIRTTNVYPMWRGCILLIRRAPTDSMNPCMWECPGGHVDTPCGYIDSVVSRKEALRELQEEVGVTAHPSELIALDSKTNLNMQTHQAYILLLNTKTPPKIKLSHEHDLFMWQPIGGLVKVSPIRREVYAFIQQQKRSLR